MALMVEPISRDLALSDTEFSVLHGLAFAIFYCLLGLPFGRLADSVSRTRLVAACIVLWSVMTMACGLARGFYSLFAARIGVGVGEAGLSPAAYSLISDYFPPERRARALSVYALGISLGVGFAYLLGGMIIAFANLAGPVRIPLLGEFRGWHLVFILAGLPGLLIAPFALLMREPRRAITDAQSRSVPLSEVVAFIRERSTTFINLFLGLALVLSAVHGAGAWWPTYFIRTHGWSIGQISLVLGLLSLTAAVGGTYFGGYVSDRLQQKGVVDATIRTCAFGISVAAPFMVAAPLLQNPWFVVAAYAIANFFIMTPWGAAAAAVQLVTPRHLRGQMSALYLATINIVGLTAGPLVIGVLNDAVFTGKAGIGNSMAAAWTVSLAGGLALLWTGLSPFRRDARSILATELTANDKR